MNPIKKIADKLGITYTANQIKALKDIFDAHEDTKILALKQIASGAVTIRAINTTTDDGHTLGVLVLAMNYIQAPVDPTQRISPEEYADRVRDQLIQQIKLQQDV